MPKLFRTSLNTFALATAALLAVPSMAAGNAAAEARARGHITTFVGHTLHGDGHTYDVRDIVVDHDGAEHVRFDRRLRGMRVIGGDFVVHSSRSGGFVGVSKTLARELRVAARAAISHQQAAAAALAAHAGELHGRPELVVYARGDAPTLAYEVIVNGQQDDGTPSEKHVIVDAASGAVIDAWDDIHTAAANGTGVGFFNGTVPLTTNSISGGFEMRDPTRGGQYTINMSNRTRGGSIFVDSDNTWGTGSLSNTQTTGVDAQYGTAMTWDYFLTAHGRRGIRNDGVGAYNRVHYGRSYNNAFWSDSCFCMTYGDGDGVNFNPFDSLDVAGHEMAHGVTSRTANLTYSGESGGLNEATSDIFGAMVEFYANNANDVPDYNIGEELYKSGTRSLRYMYSPNLDGSSADCWYSGVGSIDVHYSSGIANHFFYLLAEGTDPAGLPHSPTCVPGNTKKATGAGLLAGIGRGKADKIWYRALTLYMTSSTNYAGARQATVRAAGDLHGSGSPEAAAVAAAWSAVLVN